MMCETWRERFESLMATTNRESLGQEARYMMHDLGAELPDNRVRSLRALQSEVDERLEKMMENVGPKEWEIWRKAFVTALLFATVHIPDGYLATLGPVYERRTLFRRQLGEKIVDLLLKEPCRCVIELARELAVRPSDVARCLKWLRDHGCVDYKKVETPDGRTSRLYFLTTKGFRDLGPDQN
jgi:hypothetical protein